MCREVAMVVGHDEQGRLLPFLRLIDSSPVSIVRPTFTPRARLKKVLRARSSMIGNVCASEFQLGEGSRSIISNLKRIIHRKLIRNLRHEDASSLSKILIESLFPSTASISS